MEPDPNSEPTRPGGLRRLWGELRRRKVVRVAMTYVLTGWIIIQVASSTFADFGIPVWAFRFVVLMVCLGFPLAVILAWAFELTPDGIRTTRATREEPDTPEHPDHHRKRNWMAYGLGALLPTLIFGSLALYFYIRAPVQEVAAETVSLEALEAEAEEPEKSIAVLPLENLSPDPDNAFFAAGVHEDILTNLSKIQALRVISRTSTAGYKDTTKKLREIGQELGVRYLVEGSVRRVGDRVRVTVQLIDARTDDHLWAENFDRTLEDIFAIQSAIAKEIAAQLKTVISPEEIAKIERGPTDSMEAYELFLRFRQLQRNHGPRMGDEKIALLEKAVELDPMYAEAWAQLSIECVFWWAVGKNRADPDMLARGHEAIIEAQSLAPEAAFIPRAKAAFARWELLSTSEYNRLLKEALKIDPTYANALERLGLLNIDNGHFSAAEMHSKRLLEVEPNDGLGFNTLLNAYLYQHKWKEANLLVQQRIKQEPSYFWWGQLNYARIQYYQSGNKDAYLKQLTELEEKIRDERFRIRVALDLRKFDIAVELIYERDSSLDGLYFGSKDPNKLNAALVWFAMGVREKWLEDVYYSKKYLEDIMELDPQSFSRYQDDLALCHAFLGNREMAENLMAERTLSTLSDSMENELDLATIYLVLGDNDAALNHLAKAAEIGKPFMIEREIDLYYLWDPLRGDPRFEALLAE